MTKKRIFVAGHRGMVGSAICRQLLARNDVELIVKTHKELDLTVQKDVLGRALPSPWASPLPDRPDHLS